MRLFALLAILLLATAPSGAASLLVYSEGIFGDETHGQSGTYGAATDIFESRFSTVREVGNLSNAADFDGMDAVLIGPVNTSTRLSAAEGNNLLSFIQAGGRALLIGENTVWQNWNNDILGLVGSSNNGGQGGAVIPVVTHPLTQGVSQIQYSSQSGISAGSGSPLFLFSTNTTALYSEGAGALLYVMDSGPFVDGNIGNADNTRFTENIADWLLAAGGTEAVPVPALAALMLAAFGLRRP